MEKEKTTDTAVLEAPKNIQELLERAGNCPECNGGPAEFAGDASQGMKLNCAAGHCWTWTPSRKGDVEGLEGPHGWVTRRDDGKRAACGGPLKCEECALEVKIKEQADAEETEKNTARIVIELDLRTMKMNVNAKGGNPIQTFGMLEFAKIILSSNQATNAAKLAVPGVGGIVGPNGKRVA